MVSGWKLEYLRLTLGLAGQEGITLPLICILISSCGLYQYTMVFQIPLWMLSVGEVTSSMHSYTSTWLLRETAQNVNSFHFYGDYKWKYLFCLAFLGRGGGFFGMSRDVSDRFALVLYIVFSVFLWLPDTSSNMPCLYGCHCPSSSAMDYVVSFYPGYSRWEKRAE